jgi:hypothetical protein
MAELSDFSRAWLTPDLHDFESAAPRSCTARDGRAPACAVNSRQPLLDARRQIKRAVGDTGDGAGVFRDGRLNEKRGPKIPKNPRV